MQEKSVTISLVCFRIWKYQTNVDSKAQIIPFHDFKIYKNHFGDWKQCNQNRQYFAW